MPSILQEALESQLESLLSFQEENPEGRVCVVCFGILDERSCTCESPSWWPVAYVINRIEIQLGRVI